ncbi:putative inorganic phosphate cotransporter [Maniola hyperantus]|uniref:putative inorganic phosphate cotransporter n=1 Tax=Aphantopus hyperantus TaxID=2795564 RepID=UPI0015684424|nr:putative inorganic phosphate cotransporter isoform X1 [Maniola hyperantus]
MVIGVNVGFAGSRSNSEMLSGWRLVLSKLFIIPQRYVFAIMALLAVANAYTMRVCLNLAITQMVKKTVAVEGDENWDPDACPDPYALANKTMRLSDYLFRQTGPILFEWSEATQGLILSSFYYGYVLTHIPGGMIAERYGGKWVLGGGLLSTAVCTFITPYAVKSGGATALFILRVIEGFGEGPTMPALMAMISKWAPKSERARMGAIVFGGAQIGNIAGSYFSGLIMHTGTWENVFYMFGGFGLAWFAIWTVLCYSTPNTHPYISDNEKKFLNENVQALIHSEKQVLDPVPWKALLRSIPLWSLIIAGIGHDWGYFTMVTDLPKYMTDVLKFNIKRAGLLSALPYIAMWIASFFFGLLCDFCIKRKCHSIQNARKIYTTIAATGPGICIILASYSGCDTTLAVFWFIAAMTLMGAYYSGMKINALDITPNYAGTTTAMVNGIAAISGIITPYLIGLLTPNSTLKEWRVAFWVCLGVLVLTNIVYLIFAKGEQLWWDDVKIHGYPVNWKHGPLTLRPTDSEKAESEQTKQKQ